jgi:general secretion pathway protein J
MSTASSLSLPAVRGFTLIEVLLAIALTAVVAVMAYAGVSAAADAAERHRAQIARLGELQTAMRWLTRDLQQLIDRPVLDARGDRLPALLGGEQSDPLLELSRVGWNNPLDQPRGSVQRVRYRLDNGALRREHWLVLDRVDDDEQLQAVELLRGVAAMRIEFLDGKAGNAVSQRIGGEWMESWPVTAGDTLLPLAVRIELQLDDLGTVERIVAIASEQPQ